MCSSCFSRSLMPGTNLSCSCSWSVVMDLDKKWFCDCSIQCLPMLPQWPTIYQDIPSNHQSLIFQRKHGMDPAWFFFASAVLPGCLSSSSPHSRWNLICCLECLWPHSPRWLFPMSCIPQPHHISSFSLVFALFPSPPVYPLLLFINILYPHVLKRTKTKIKQNEQRNSNKEILFLACWSHFWFLGCPDFLWDEAVFLSCYFFHEILLSSTTLEKLLSRRLPGTSYDQMLLQFLFSHVNWLYIEPNTVDPLVLPPGLPALSRFSWLLLSYLPLKGKGVSRFHPWSFC